jgi:hypothetical protein
MIPLTLRCPLCGWLFAWHEDGGVGQPVCQACRREQDEKAAERQQED